MVVSSLEISESNRLKNMMLDTWDGQIFFPRYYDIDTILSYDNSGEIKFDVDIEMEQGYWNTSSSRLWTKVRDLFHDELIEVYKDMRANGVTYENIMHYMYDEQIAKIPQSYFNQDYDIKYAPYSDQYLGKAHGDGLQHMKRWLKRRFLFCDTLFDYAPSYNNDVLTIRANTTEEMTLEIETYSPVYQHISWYNGQMDKKKIDGKTSVTFNGFSQTATDQEVLIYGGSNIKSIKGISSMNPNSMLIGGATRLTELDISNCPILTIVNSNKANFSPHTYLNKLNMSNCPQLGGNLNVSNSPLLQEINAKGSGVTGLLMPTSLRNLKTLRLPNTLRELTLHDVPLLNTLEFDKGVNLQSISLTNCNQLNNCINFDLTKTPTVLLDNSYNTDELYMSATTNLTLRNMPSLKRVIFTPNSEYSAFDINNVLNGANYKITTFNNPMMTDFITTAPHRLSYNNCGMKDKKLLPSDMVFTNSSYIDYITGEFTIDALISSASPTYVSIMGGLTYTLDYAPTKTEAQIVLYKNKMGYTLVEGESYYSDVALPFTFTVPKGYKYLRFHINTKNVNVSDVSLTVNGEEIIQVKDYGDITPNTAFTANTLDLADTQFQNVKFLCTTDIYNLKVPTTMKNFYCDSAMDIDTDVIEDASYEVIHEELIEPYTTNYEGEVKLLEQVPNIIPSSANGSLIFNMYSNNTTPPTSTSPYMWDLTGLKLEDFYTYGMNNWVKPGEDSYVKNNTTQLYGAIGAYDGTTFRQMDASDRRCLSISPILIAEDVARIKITTSSNTSMYHYSSDDYDRSTGTVTTQSFPGGMTSGGTWIGNSAYPIGAGKYAIRLISFFDYTRVEWFAITTEDINGVESTTRFYMKDISIVTKDEFAETPIIEELTYSSELAEIKSITMPQRMPGYSVRLVNADITPDEYPTMLYPKLIDTTLPITGKLDYTKYNGTSLAWAYAYTTGDVDIKPLGSQHQGNITHDYNKLYGTDFVDVRDVWVYKDTDVSKLSTNEAITKAYIELTSANYESRIDEVLQWYPNCHDIYLFDDGSVTNLQFMYSNGGHNNAHGTRLQVQNVTFMEGYFNNLNNLSNAFTNCLNLVIVNNIPKSVTDFRGCFENCQKLNCQFDLSDYNISTGRLEGTFFNNYKLSYTPILPSNYTGSMSSTFRSCSSLTTAPTIPQGVTNMNSTFTNCTSLTQAPTIPNGVTNMYYTFSNCTSLTQAPNIPDSVTDMGGTFKYCTSLTTIPTIPNSVIYLGDCFNGCTSLTQITFKNVGKYYVNALNGTFQDAINLTTLDMGALDLQSVGNTNSTFARLTNLVDFVPPKNIKASGHGINLSNSTLLSHDILIAILNNLATVNSSTLTLGETLLGKLTEEEIEQATNKGWILQ